MTGTIRTTTVQGRTYKVWSDFIKVATFAENEEGTVMKIRSGGYIKNDLTVRKAIAEVFQLDSFRK